MYISYFEQFLRSSKISFSAPQKISHTYRKQSNFKPDTILSQTFVKYCQIKVSAVNISIPAFLNKVLWRYKLSSN